VSLLWAVPVVAAAVATLLVAARARSIEDEAQALARSVAQLGDVRRPLAALRDVADETDELVEEFRRHHPPGRTG
jgi:hypothetical protein